MPCFQHSQTKLLVPVMRAHMMVMLWNICDGILLLHYSAPTQLGIGSSCQSRTHDKNAAKLLQLFWRREMLQPVLSKRAEIQKGVEMQHFA